jgi:hypothetical protein
MPIDWKKLDDQSRVVVPAKPANGLWTLVRSYVGSSQIIRIEAQGQWKPVPGVELPCGADGLQHWMFGRDHLLYKKAPLGALIGKIGGSNISTEESEIFLVGSTAVLTIDKILGPLYLTINDAPGCFDDNSGELNVTIS